MALRWVPADPPASGPRRSARQVAARIDLPGMVGFGGFMTALMVFLMDLPGMDWIALAVAVLLVVPLVWWELRAATPFFDIRGLGANAALTRTYVRTSLTLLGTYTVMYGLTQWLEAGRGLSTEEAGLLLLPMGALSALVSRPLSRRNLVRGPLVTAGVAMLAGSLGIFALTAHSPVVLVVAVTLVFGLCVGTATVSNQTALYTQSPPDQIGTASGLFRTFGYLGSIISATITGIAFKHGATDSGLHAMAIILIAAGAAVLAMTLLDRGLTRKS